MIPLLFLLTLQLATQPAGLVTGRVLTASGAPAAGVRVYAVSAGDGTAAITETAPLEAITQTDSNGQYRLEIKPGRYYIAGGAVQAPTFAPGTASRAAARVVTVSAVGVAANIDIAGFVAARTDGPFFPGPISGTGEMRGTVRYSDGTPASDIPVIAFDASGRVISAGNSANNGSYQFLSVPAGTYTIFAGYAGMPSKYAVPVVIPSVTANSPPAADRRDNLDFQINVLRQQTVIRGKVLTADRMPLGGVTVTARSDAPGGNPLPAFVPAPVTTSPDGSFEFSGSFIVGAYTIMSDVAGVSRSVQVVVISRENVVELVYK